MSKANPHKKNLKKIASNSELKDLDTFKNKEVWENLESADKALLAELFVKQGEQLLAKDDPAAVESFQTSLLIMPECPRIHFLQGSAWRSRRHNYKCLTQAAESFEKAIKLDPTHLQAHMELVATNLEIVLIQYNSDIILRTLELFSDTERLAKKVEFTLTGDFYNLWGLSHYVEARESQEAIDLKYSIEKYKEAEERGCQDKFFRFNFANALFDLAVMTKQPEIMKEAYVNFEKAVAEQDEFFEGWTSLALCSKNIYEETGDENYFDRAEESFVTAAKLNPNNTNIWMMWGRLHLNDGKDKRNPETVHQSIDKFEKADAIEPNEPEIMIHWADALMVIGSLEEKFECLKEAEAKILHCIELSGQEPFYWFLYNNCMVMLGRYFSDEKYYQTAIDAAKHGIELNERAEYLWSALGNAYYAMGEHLSDPEYIEKAVNSCGKIFEINPSASPKFLNDWGVCLMKLAEMKHDLRYIPMAVNKFEEAIQRFNATHKISADPEWYYNYGCALDYLGDYFEDPNYYEKAIAVLSDVLQSYPQSYQARYNLAAAMYHFGDLTGEIEFLERSIEHFKVLILNDPEDDILYTECALAMFVLAEILDDDMKSESSIFHLAQAEQTFMQAIGHGSVSAYFHLAGVYAMQGNFPEAMHFLERAKQGNVLPPITELVQDPRLWPLRDTPQFRTFIQELG